jgi:hypothetical protein
MIKDDKIIDLTQINEDKDYIVTALMPLPEIDKATNQPKLVPFFVHFSENPETKNEEFNLHADSVGCCIFNKENAYGVAEQIRQAFPNAQVKVHEVEYNKRKKTYKLAE